MDVGPAPYRTPTLTRLAARRLRAIAASELAPDLRHKAGLCLLDYLGACIQGLSAPWAPALLCYAESRRGAPESHQWGSDALVTAETAAFTNAALGHSIIRDDMHVGNGSHIGVLVIPAALALAQRDGWSGRALVCGLVGGYEMSICLGTAVRKGVLHRHFRPSGIHGAFGATAAAIAATNLSEDMAMQALGFAANSAAGVNEWPWAGGQEIYTHMGMASRAGVTSFDLARTGMQASASVLEGRDGLFAAYGSGTDGDEAFAGSLTEPLHIHDVHFKPYAGCNLIQTPLAAAIMLSPQVSNFIDDIEDVMIRTFAQAVAYPGCDNIGPFSQVQQSKMSLQFAVSSALLYGKVDEESYVQFSDPRLKRLIACCQLVVDPDLTQFLLQGKQPARIEVRLKDRRTFYASLDDVPWLAEEDVRARFRQEAANYLSSDAIEKIISFSAELWEMEDCGPLFTAISSHV